MFITKETVKYVAHLARIELKEEELDKLSLQLQRILEFIDKLKKVNVDSIEPTSHILPLKNVFREDIIKTSLTQEEVMKNAPQKREDYFIVPKIIE